MKQNQLNRIEQGIARLEAKVDALLEALAEEDGEEEQQGQYDLDGNLTAASERDTSESLG